MALVVSQQAADRLATSCARLRETLEGLRMTMVEDRPHTLDLALIDLRGDAIEDLCALAGEAVGALAHGAAAPEDDPSGGAVHPRALVACHETLNRLGLRFHADLTAYERMRDLIAAGREHGREAVAWLGGVRGALEETREALGRAHQALVGCWRELADAQPTNFGTRRRANALRMVKASDGG
jgi:hypothetical protein